MPNIKDFTDALTALTAPVAGDLVYVRNAAGNRKMTVQNLLNGINTLPINRRDGGDIGGYLMDGVNDYITVPDDANLDFGLSDFSLELFVGLADYTPSAELILLEKHASNLGYKLLLTTAGKLKLQFGNGTNFTTFSYESDAIGVTDDSWAHFLVTADRDGNALFYVNGILNKTVDISGSVAQTLDNTGALNIFGNGTSCTLGRVAIVRAYNRVLTATEIANSYNNGRPDLYELFYKYKCGSNNSMNLNPTFEADTDDTLPADWYAQGNHTLLAKTDGTAPEGSKVAEINASGALSAGSSFVNPFSTANGPIIQDKKCKLTFWAKSISGGTTLRFLYLMTNAGVATDQVITSDWMFYTLEGNILTNAFRFGLTALGVARIDNFKIVYSGCTAEYLFKNAGSLGWIESSGNQLSGTTVGSPLCLTKEVRPPHYRDIRKAITANTNTTLTSIVPRGYKIVSIRAKGSDSLADIKIGSSSGGEQIVAATTTSSTTPKLLTLAATANDAYSESADVTLYARHDTSASGKTMDLIFHFEKVGN